MSDVLGFLSPAALEALEQLISANVAAEFERRAERNGAARWQSPYITIPEAAEYLRCSRQRVDDLLSQRRLRRYKDGSRTLVSRDELRAYVEKTSR